MMLPNITGDENNINEDDDQAWDEYLSNIGILLSVLNILVSITAFLGNALILAALHKVSSIYPPTKLLFQCLAVSDLCVGLIRGPLFVAGFLFALFNDF